MIYVSVLLIIVLLFLFAIGAFLIADSKYNEYRKGDGTKKNHDKYTR